MVAVILPISPWTGPQMQTGILCHTVLCGCSGWCLVDALEKNDILDKTIIVFGRTTIFPGERVCGTSARPERSARVPLIISVPGMAKGERSNKPVELLDLYPP